MKIDSKGFTLVEIIIATGLLAALSLGVMSIRKNMATGQATSETKMEELEIRRIIMTNLLDQTACVNTFGGTNIGAPINQIRNSLNTPIFQVNNTYGNNTIQLVAMSTQDLAAVNTTTRDINLNLSFRRMKALATNSGTIKNVSIQIRVNAVSGTSPITGCFVDASATNQAMCLAIGGIWNSGVNTCSPIPYVSLAGDTMSGALNAPSLVSTGGVAGVTGQFSSKITSPSFCTGSNCKAISDLALANSVCPAGQAQVGVQLNGTPSCKPLQCGSNLYFAGLDGASNPICRPYPTNTCPTNQYVSSVNADGTVNCAILPNNANAVCPAGQVIQSINAGIPVCVNKGAGVNCGVGGVVTAVHADGTVSCGTGFTTQTCPSGQSMTGMNANGTIICNPVATTSIIEDMSWLAVPDFNNSGAQNYNLCRTQLASLGLYAQGWRLSGTDYCTEDGGTCTVDGLRCYAIRIR